MTRRGVAIFALTCLLTGCAAHLPKPAVRVAVTEAKSLVGVTVVLDPGHGGEDSGAVVGDVREDALTYRAAVETAQALREAGASVVFTVKSRMLDAALAESPTPPDAPTDASLAVNSRPLVARASPRQLYARAAVARQAWRRSPDPARVFFLSLHFDDFHRSSVHGALICVDKRTRGTPKLADALAREMGDEVAAGRGIERRKLGVLNPDYNPVPERVLLEMATLSNEADAQIVQNKAWRQEMARRIASAVTEIVASDAAAPSQR